MIILGIEFKAADTILAIARVDGDTFSHMKVKPARLKLADGDDQAEVRIFAEAFRDFAKSSEAEHIYVRKRGKKGPYSGGAETFRMEGLVQFMSPAPVVLVAPQRIAAANKKSPVDIPESIAKFQENAWLSAVVGHASAQSAD